MANQLTTSEDVDGTTSYDYDPAGNLHLIESPDGARTTYTWDDQNQQTGVALPSGALTTSTYRFDRLRHSREDAHGVLKYVWDQQNYLAETDGDNQIQAVFTNEPQQYGNLISQYRKGPTSSIASYYHYDALGSTQALTDESGDTTDVYIYDAWGNEVAAEGSTMNPFRWPGQVGYYYDDMLGTFYVRARVYDPARARWMSQDPLFYPSVSPLRPSDRSRQRHEIHAWDHYVAYFVPNTTDPSGCDLSTPKCGCKWPFGARGDTSSGKAICAITMLDSGATKFEPGGLNTIDAPVPIMIKEGVPNIDPSSVLTVDQIKALAQQQILNWVNDNKCCTLYLLGHRGGKGNEGGIVTYPFAAPKDKEKVTILPDPAFDAALGTALKTLGCNSCAINLVTCGSDPTDKKTKGFYEKGQKIREDMASATGCVVCGSKAEGSLGLQLLNKCTPSGFQWKSGCAGLPNPGFVWP